MLERAVDLETPDGRMPVFITHPEEGPHPTVILFMDALGIREELRDMARRIGTVGYYVMLANLFYRDGGPSFDPALLPTQGPDPEMMRINMATTHAMVLADTLAMLRFAADDPAARDPVGTIGYCMGGRHAYAAAGRFPDRVAAMASLHAGFQVTDRPDSAHLLDPAHQGRVLFRLRRRRSALAARAPKSHRRGMRTLGRRPPARDFSRREARLHLPRALLLRQTFRRARLGARLRAVRPPPAVASTIRRQDLSALTIQLVTVSDFECR